MHALCGGVRAEAHAAADMSLWEAWYSQDGVTVFFGTSAENQDVVMVSFIVHAPPNLVTEARLLSLPSCSLVRGC